MSKGIRGSKCKIQLVAKMAEVNGHFFGVNKLAKTHVKCNSHHKDVLSATFAPGR